MSFLTIITVIAYFVLTVATACIVGRTNPKTSKIIVVSFIMIAAGSAWELVNYPLKQPHNYPFSWVLPVGIVLFLFANRRKS